MPRHHRPRDDAPLHRRHRRGPRGSHRPGTGGPDGQARRDRRRRALALLRRSRVHHRPRHGRRRRPDRLAMRKSSAQIGSSRIGFVGAACSLVAVFAASASPIPLYELYGRTDGLSHADLSLTAVAYFVAAMATLVVLGRLSNQLGRRPVALAALAVTAAGTLLLTQVHSVAPLIAGRVLQGIGCGLASSALTAFVVDSAPTSPSWLPHAATPR